MIGPGWMPSRPRPLYRVKRSLLAYSWRSRRRRRGQTAQRTAQPDGARATARWNPIGMLFDISAAELPTATLLPSAAQPRHLVIGGLLRQWCVDRWTWLRPRTVPMIVAIAGTLAVLGTTRYLSTSACSAPPRSYVIYDGPDAHAPAPGHDHDHGHMRVMPLHVRAATAR